MSLIVITLTQNSKIRSIAVDFNERTSWTNHSLNPQMLTCGKIDHAIVNQSL